MNLQSKAYSVLWKYRVPMSLCPYQWLAVKTLPVLGDSSRNWAIDYRGFYAFLLRRTTWLPPYWDASSSSAGQRIPSLLWNTNIHDRVHNSCTLDRVPNEINSAHFFTSSSIKITFPDFCRVPWRAWTNASADYDAIKVLFCSWIRLK
jgi:hypothetical protein